MWPCCCQKKKGPCPAADKLREWLAAGARHRLTLRREDFLDREFSLSALLFSGPLSEGLAQRWRSFCSYMGNCSPFCGWKAFWYRRAGVTLGKSVYFSPGVVLDILFPQLITFEDDVVLGFDAMVMAHIYTPDRIVIGRATVRERGLVGGRAVLAATSVGKEAVLGASSYTTTPIPAGHTALGVPAQIKKRKCTLAEEENHDHSA